MTLSHIICPKLLSFQQVIHFKIINSVILCLLGCRKPSKSCAFLTSNTSPVGPAQFKCSEEPYVASGCHTWPGAAIRGQGLPPGPADILEVSLSTLKLSAPQSFLRLIYWGGVHAQVGERGEGEQGSRTDCAEYRAPPQGLYPKALRL